MTDLFGNPIDVKKTPQQIHDEQELAQANELAEKFRLCYLGNNDHFVNIHPMPTPRIRGRIVEPKGKTPFVSFYHPKDYTDYMDQIAAQIRGMVLLGKIQRGDYSTAFITFGLQYPASTPKKNLIERAYHLKRGDADNMLKGVLDAITKAQVFEDDGCIANLIGFKRMTLKEGGYIGFTLVK